MKNESRKKTERMNAELVSHIQKPISGHQQEVWAKAHSLKRSGFSQEEALAEMSNHWGDYHKDVSPAVRRAAERVYSGGFVRRGRAYPPSSEELISKVVQENPFTVSDLQGASPCAGPESFPTWGMLQLLFPSDALICMGESPSEFKTKPLEEFVDEGGGLPLIVPRTMARRSGLTLEGKVSERCNDNAGPLRYVVVEFDDAGEDEQACLHRHLSQFLPLVLVLHSGGKSLHGWHNAVGASEERVDRFKMYAAALGADPQVFVPSQMVRMPNAIRPENGELQRLLYFDNGMLPSKAEGEAVIDFDELPLAPEIGVDDEPNEVEARPGPVMLDWREFDAHCPPEPPELVSEILHEGCKMVIGGHSKSYKSWLALQLAVSVSSGQDFLGLPTVKSPVCYLNLELRDFAVRKRIRIMTEALELELEEGQFHIVNARGKWHGVQSLEAMVSDLIAKGVKLLFIDPIYKLQPFDENNTAEVGSLLQSLDRLVEETGAALVYVHHYRKSGGGKAMDKLSGSGLFNRDFDSMMGIEWQEPSQKGVTGHLDGNLSFVMRSHQSKDDLRIRREHPLIVEVEEPGDHTIGDPPQES
jgi:hypothetical protein